jgi:hypothetical protein
MIMCKIHPKYKAIQIPKVNCDVCWKIWEDRHPGFKKVARVPPKKKQKRPCKTCD